MNIRVKHESLLCNWIKDSMNDPKIGNLAASSLGPLTKNGIIWQLNLTRKDSEKIFHGQGFWHSIVHAWHKYNYSEPQNAAKVMEQCIWYNSHIQIENQPVTGPISMLYIKDFWNFRLNRFHKFSELKPEDQKCLSWLLYRSIISAIPALWKFYLNTPGLLADAISKYAMLQNMHKVSGWVYKDKIKSTEALCKVSSLWVKKANFKETAP